METLEKNKEAIKGGEYLIRETDAQDVFIPGEFTEEEKMMAAAANDFVEHEIRPLQERLENGEWQLGGEILKKAGQLGLLGISIPEAYGGLGMSFNMSMLMADVTGGTGSFTTTYGAHTGIGTLPILYYGTEEQKQKYVTKLATGEWIGCYCLTEPDAGSDANSGKTSAKLSDDGKHYIINGQKMWISNAGYADVLIVFAKIDDDKNLTAFILEKDFDGITMNDEEKKLGIKGSSTRQVFFNDVKVPVENMLYEREKGFKIAVNILNIGRIKLGVAAIGGAKEVINHAVNYANERKQFGQSISSYGAIKTKIANMVTRTWVSESINYRAGHNIDEKTYSLINDEGMEESEAKLKGIEQFAIESSISKVHGSEVIDYVVDEGVQIYGGMGFSADAPMERAYRDSRIARIYEGTNEINRMLMVDMVFKRALKGELDLLEPATAVGKELTAVPSFESVDLSAFLARELAVVKNLKKVFLMIGGKAAQTLGADMAQEQEILMNIADIMIEIYAAESAILRAQKLHSLQGDAAEIYGTMAKHYLFEAVEKVATAGREAISSFTKGDEQKVMLMGLKRWTKTDLDNIRDLRREVADYAIEANGYPFRLF